MSVKVHSRRADNLYKTKPHQALVEPAGPVVLVMEADMAWAEKRQPTNILRRLVLVPVALHNSPLGLALVDHLTKYLLGVVKDRDL